MSPVDCGERFHNPNMDSEAKGSFSPCGLHRWVSQARGVSYGLFYLLGETHSHTHTLTLTHTHTLTLTHTRSQHTHTLDTDTHTLSTHTHSLSTQTHTIDTDTHTHTL